MNGQSASDSPENSGRVRGVRCRPLAESDHPALVRLLCTAFPTRTAVYWEGALKRLDHHTRSHGFPSSGYVLADGHELVGVLLTISRRDGSGPEAPIRCNLSSWCVADGYGAYAPLLVSAVCRDPQVTYVNISPERATRPIVEAQGFRRYGGGLFVSVPLLAPARDRARLVAAGAIPPEGATSADATLMADHAPFACLRAWCITADRAFPLIFMSVRYARGLIPAAYVIYCPDPDVLVRYAQPIGLFLARRAIPVMTFDAEGPVAGLPGRFLGDRMPKYYKGPHRPRLGDLAYSELPMFGP